jgi:hypothetical protein
MFSLLFADLLKTLTLRGEALNVRAISRTRLVVLSGNKNLGEKTNGNKLSI